MGQDFYFMFFFLFFSCYWFKIWNAVFCWRKGD